MRNPQTDELDQIRLRCLACMRAVIANDPDTSNELLFCNKIGLINTSLYRWKNGTGGPTLQNVVMICKKFNISPSYIILGQGDMYGDAEVIKRIENLEKKVRKLEKLL